MATLPVPSDGLVLLRTPDHGPSSNPALPLQVMRLSMAKKTTDEILKSFRNKEKVSVRFGKRVVIQHGKKSYPLFAFPEPHPSELYERSQKDESTFYFSGKLSHRLETQKAQFDTAKADEALLNLENSLKSYEEQKASNEARFVTDKDELRHLTEVSQKGKASSNQPPTSRKDRLLNTLGRSGPSSPFLGETASPATGSTSAGRLGATSIGKDQVRLNAVKIPFLHLLAVKASTPNVLTQTLHTTKEDCEKLLHKYGKDVGEANGKQELKDKAYRELDLWKFPYPDAKDRQAAIDRAISAFDRMRISTSDRIWETLLPVQERGIGKGSELSRLKIGQVGLNGVIPKLGSSHGGSHSVTDTDTDQGKPARKAKAITKAKPKGGTSSSQDKVSTLPKDSTKENPRKEKKKPGQNGKFKSSEVIEDSDEELQAAENAIEDTAKSTKRLTTKVRSSTSIQSSKPTASASKPPLSSSGPAVIKAASSLLPGSALSRPRSDSTTNKASPRSRTDSSPQKPSPLASSPPTNATDLENSQSSKPNSLSSKTSSPASPHRDRNQKVAPTSNPAEPRASSSVLKRKAEEQSTSASKRQQTNGNHVARPITTNGINRSNFPQSKDATIATTKTAASSSSQRSRTPSSSSISTSTSTTAGTSTTTRPASSTLQSDLQLKSKSHRFKVHYARYQALHAKMMALPDKERDAEEVKVLRKMHERIGELKREIWEGWESGGGGGAAIGSVNGNGRRRKG